MNKRLLGILAVGALFTAISTGVSYADPIGPVCTHGDKDTCQGSIYTLTWNGVTDGTPNTYDITLTIDTSGYTGGGAAIDSVAIKVAPSEAGGSVDVAPTTLANWVPLDGGISAGGCDGAGSGFLCAQNTTDPAAVGGTLVWTFDYVTTDAIDTSSFGSVIKARYVDAEGEKIGDLVSEPITLQLCESGSGPDCGGGPVGGVPEPGSIVLLGSALLFAGAKLRKRFVQS